MVSGYSTSTSFLQVDGWSTDPRVLERHSKTTLTCIKHLITHSTYQVDPFVIGLQIFTMLVNVTVMVVYSIYYGSSFSRL